jgi:K+-sensing histidine kinase KdpD
MTGTVTREQRTTWLALIAAVAGPVGAAAVLIPLRTQIGNTNIALVLVVVVVAVATLGRRFAAAVAAISAAAWFDFFHTLPHYSFSIRAHDDVVTAGLLLVVGLAVGELAVRSRRHRSAAVDGSTDIGRIHAIAELAASGEEPDFVILAVAGELLQILSLRDCRFDLYAPGDKPIARIERNGEVTVGQLRWGVDTMGLPTKQVELLIEGGGRPLGRFVLSPTPGKPIPFDKRLVAIALADQAGAALATAPAQ